MTPVFADTAYFIALVSPADELHARAKEITPGVARPLVTTAWVMTELVDALSRPPNRAAGAGLVRDLYRDPRVTVVPPTQELFDAGLDFFEQRQDKDWSLTDCISFVVMEQHGLSDALTADRHFAQAGFNILLK